MDSKASVPTAYTPRAASSALAQTPFNEKVTELFLTASSTFQRLGDMTALLNANNIDHDESRWTDEQVVLFSQALTRFSTDIEQLHESLLERTKKMIRTDIKRRTLQMGDPTISGGGGGTTMNSVTHTTHQPPSDVQPRLLTQHDHPSNIAAQSQMLSAAIPTTSTMAINQPIESSQTTMIIVDNPDSPSKHEQPPALSPEEAPPAPIVRQHHQQPLPITRQVPPPQYQRILGAATPNAKNAAGQSIAVRRVPAPTHHILSRPSSQQNVRLANRSVSTTRPRMNVNNYAHYNVLRPFTSSPHIPRGPSISPQLIAASSVQMRQTSGVGDYADRRLLPPTKLRRMN